MNESNNLFSEFPIPEIIKWVEEIEKSIKNNPIESLYSETYEGIKIKPFYSTEDLLNIKHLKQQYPGFYPYVRGCNQESYKIKEWFISQEIPEKKPRDFNRISIDNISKGQTALKITDKLEIKSAKDFSIALNGIDMSKVPINIDAGYETYSFFKLLKESFNGKFKDIKGGLDYDPIGMLAQKSRLNCSQEEAYDYMYKMIKDTESSDFKIIGVKGSIYHESGSNIIQELAYAFATAVSYVRVMLDKGLAINAVANKIRFIFTISSDFFMEIAKIRAARMIWAKIVEEFGGGEEYQKMNLYAITTGTNKSKADPYINILRNTTEALSAIYGGCDTLEIRFFNEDFTVINELSQRVSRNTQIVLSEECNTTEVIDPAGGSYYVESLTEQIALKSWDLFREVEKEGGMLKALEKNIIQEEIRKIVERRYNNLSFRKEILVGINKYFNIRNKNFDTGFGGLEKKAIESKESNIKINSLPVFRASDYFEKFLLKAEEYKIKNEEYPKIFFAAIGETKQLQSRIDFAIDLLNLGGFEIVHEKNYTNIDEALNRYLDSDLSLICICSTDDNYNQIIPKAEILIKNHKYKTYMVIIGYPDKELNTLANSSKYEYVNAKSNIISFLNNLYNHINETIYHGDKNGI
jgi:methylmalonyl-CoA mutase